jgi:hypothetical protein
MTRPALDSSACATHSDHAHAFDQPGAERNLYTIPCTCSVCSLLASLLTALWGV